MPSIDCFLRISARRSKLLALDRTPDAVERLGEVLTQARQVERFEGVLLAVLGDQHFDPSDPASREIIGRRFSEAAEVG